MYCRVGVSCYTALTMPLPQKLFIYARKSTDDRDKQVQSIPDQISELRAFAREQGIHVIEVLTEKQSARSPGRKVFEEMLVRISQGEAEGILAWHPDRLARNMTDGAKLIELVETVGANLVFPTYRFDNTPHGLFCLSLAFGQSKLYVDNLRENVTRGMRNKAKRGIYPAKPPIGYVNNRNTRMIDPDPEYASLVVSLFEKYSTGRYTLGELQIPKGTGKYMAKSAVQSMLRNPFYYGIFSWAGETYEGTHTPLITKKLFDQCQVVMEQRGHNTRRHKRSKHPFRQLLKCNHCGCSITSSIAKGTYTYYHCSRKKGKCNGKFVRDTAIAEEIRSALQKVSLTPADAQKLEEGLRKLHDQETKAGVNRAETFRSQLKTCNEKLNTLLDMSISGDITRDEYLTKKQNLIEKKTELEQTLRNVSDGGAVWLELALSILNQAAAIPNALKSSDPAFLADIFKKVGSNRTLRASTIVFRPRSGWNALFYAPRGRAAQTSHTNGSECEPFVLSGGPDRVRTCDLRSAKPVL